MRQIIICSLNVGQISPILLLWRWEKYKGKPQQNVPMSKNFTLLFVKTQNYQTCQNSKANHRFRKSFATQTLKCQYFGLYRVHIRSFSITQSVIG